MKANEKLTGELQGEKENYIFNSLYVYANNIIFARVKVMRTIYPGGGISRKKAVGGRPLP